MLINITKVCGKQTCKKEKLLSEFSKNKREKDGLERWCKQCRTESAKIYYIQNKEKIKIDSSLRYENKSYQKLEYSKKYYQENKEKIKIKNKIYSQYNKEHRWEKTKEYNKQNKHIIKWRDLLKTYLRKTNNIKNNKTEKLLGYSYHQFKKHLDKQGMNWNIDQVDHKVPISWFIETTPPHIVNDLRNLQPLNEGKNKSKRNFYSHKIDKDYYDLILEYIKEKYKNQISFGTKEKNTSNCKTN